MFTENTDIWWKEIVYVLFATIISFMNNLITYYELEETEALTILNFI